ncbi:MAG: DUF1461 domain-containing protein [Nanoarchaeota archaeon]
MIKEKAALIFFCFFLTIFILLFSYKTTLYFSELTPEQKNTIDFLSNKEDFDNKEELKINYTTAELSHLEDVRKVMKVIDYFFYVSLLIVTATLTFHRKNKEKTKKLLKYGGITAVLFVLAVLLFSLVSFDISFTLFHQVFFPQGNWIFPADSLLIRTFPLEFFVKISRSILVQAFLWGMIFILLSYFLLKLRKKRV